MASKNRTIKQKGGEKGMNKKINKKPRGWIKTRGATTAPKGYYWVSNGKSRFSGERKIALVKK